MLHQDDQKYEPESEDDQFQETIVTGGDGGRRRVYECDPQPTDIYQYIGQIYTTFDYMNEYQYRVPTKGTGTIIFIRDADKEKRAYILTCAHNMRRNIMYCKECNIYREIRDKNGKTSCRVCGERKTSNQIKKVIKATKITFMPRSIEAKNFGLPLIKKDYICQEEYVPDRKYIDCPMPKDGFDWAFISFLDIYNIYTKQPNIEVVNGKDVFNAQLKREYRIFGYPGDKDDDKMWGMISDADNFKQFQINTNAVTKQDYLYQVAIDTMVGESGALLWFKEKDIVKVCGVHCGGSKGTPPYNIATLVGREIIQKWNQIKSNNSKSDGFGVFVSRVGLNDADIKVKWNGIDDCKGDDIVISVEISEDEDFLFVDQEFVFKGNELGNIMGLKQDTFYLLRAKRGDRDENEMKFGVEWWNDAAVTSFVTGSYPELIDEWSEYPNLLQGIEFNDDYFSLRFTVKETNSNKRIFKILNVNGNDNDYFGLARLGRVVIRRNKLDGDVYVYVEEIFEDTLCTRTLAVFDKSGNEQVSNTVTVQKLPESVEITDNYKPPAPLKDTFKQYYDENKTNILIIWDYPIYIMNAKWEYDYNVQYKIKLSNKTDYEVINEMPYRLPINTITTPIELNVCIIISLEDDGKRHESEPSGTIIVYPPPSV